jgi:hypothetical protein
MTELSAIICFISSFPQRFYGALLQALEVVFAACCSYLVLVLLFEQRCTCIELLFRSVCPGRNQYFGPLGLFGSHARGGRLLAALLCPNCNATFLR